MVQFGFIQSNLRAMKRQYGVSLLLTNALNAATIDWSLGTASGRNIVTKDIMRATVMPITQSRLAVGVGQVSLADIEIIIDKGDLGSFILSKQTVITYNNSTYGIESLEDYFEGNSFVAACVRMEAS